MATKKDFLFVRKSLENIRHWTDTEEMVTCKIVTKQLREGQYRARSIGLT